MPAESASRSASPSSTARDRAGDGTAVARQHPRDQRVDIHRPKPTGRRDPRRRARGVGGRAPGIARRASRSERQYARCSHQRRVVVVGAPWSATIARFTCSRWSRCSSAAARAPGAPPHLAHAPRDGAAGARAGRELLGGDAVEADLAGERPSQPAPLAPAGQDRPRSRRTRAAAALHRGRDRRPSADRRRVHGSRREQVEQRRVPQEVAEHRQRRTGRPRPAAGGRSGSAAPARDDAPRCAMPTSPCRARASTARSPRPAAKKPCSTPPGCPPNTPMK